MVRRALILAALLLTIPVRAWASDADCHELVMSYILADQDKPTEPGDYLYTETDERGQFPRLLATTAYCEGNTGCKGDKMRRGYVAYTPDSFGYAVQLYKATPTDDGYEMGDYLGLFEIRDTGFGHETGKGKSSIRPDKKSKGSIEAGQTIDVYRPTLSECKKWMIETEGMCFAVIIPAKG